MARSAARPRTKSAPGTSIVTSQDQRRASIVTRANGASDREAVFNDRCSRGPGGNRRLKITLTHFPGATVFFYFSREGAQTRAKVHVCARPTLATLQERER